MRTLVLCSLAFIVYGYCIFSEIDSHVKANAMKTLGLGSESSQYQPASLPHGHDLKVLVDQSFAPLDYNPKDGVLTEAEWDGLINKYDPADNDSCISRQEYYSFQPNSPHDVLDKMFNHFDHDHDQCLGIPDMSTEFHRMDHNGDGSVTLHEYDQYYTHLLTTLYGHGGHG